MVFVVVGSKGAGLPVQHLLLDGELIQLIVLAEVGYEAATTHAIASSAGTAIGSLYQFFPDKLAIFHALEARHMEQVTAIHAKLMTPQMAQLPLEQMIQQIVETFAVYFEHPGPKVV